tara:strand:+ start:202 stop:1398 length:1197 start_codon:yes stop_codon:yes gene_type:complete
MSTLKVNKLRDTAGSADAIVLDPNGGAVLAGVTTVTSVKVGAAVTISESGIEASGIGITCANINGTQIGGRRNIVINGAMNVAQRGTSSTSDGFGSLDRFMANLGGNDENATQSQADISSGTTPYTTGFRKSFKFTNGNQTGGAGSGDRVTILHRIEAQDIANSGWNYTDPNSFITLSFWVKSSVAQNFYGFLRTSDGTAQLYPFETGSLSQDAWTKITKTIPGNSNLQFDNNVNIGLEIEWDMFRGTDTTGSISLNAWGAYNSSVRVPDMTSDWYETDNATFELTGVQLEVGSQATPFEHRSFGEELALCQRYFYKYDLAGIQMNLNRSGGRRVANVYFPTEMRTNPSVTITTQFDDGGATISADGIRTKHFYFVQASSSASNDAPNVSVFTSDAEL